MKCLDTYALVEIHNGNPLFMGVFKEQIVIPEVVLAEFVGVLLRRYNEKTADYWVRRLEPYTVTVGLSVFLGAVKFRYKYKEKNFSFFDAVGYVYSLTNNCLFVTGDKAFKGFKSVNHIK